MFVCRITVKKITGLLCFNYYFFFFLIVGQFFNYLHIAHFKVHVLPERKKNKLSNRYGLTLISNVPLHNIHRSSRHFRIFVFHQSNS